MLDQLLFDFLARTFTVRSSRVLKSSQDRLYLGILSGDLDKMLAVTKPRLKRTHTYDVFGSDTELRGGGGKRSNTIWKYPRSSVRSDIGGLIGKGGHIGTVLWTVNIESIHTRRVSFTFLFYRRLCHLHKIQRRRHDVLCFAVSDAREILIKVMVALTSHTPALEESIA